MQTEDLLKEVCALNERYIKLCKGAEEGQLADLSRRLSCSAPLLYRLRELDAQETQRLTQTPYCLVKATITAADVEGVRRALVEPAKSAAAPSKQVLSEVRALNSRYVSLCKLPDEWQVADAVLLLNIRYEVLTQMRRLSLDELDRLVSTDRCLVQFAVNERSLDQALRFSSPIDRYTYLASSVREDGYELDRQTAEV